MHPQVGYPNYNPRHCLVYISPYSQLLPHVTPIVTGALTNQELSLAATMALKDISRDCTDGMRHYADQVPDLGHSI